MTEPGWVSVSLSVAGQLSAPILYVSENEASPGQFQASPPSSKDCGQWLRWHWTQHCEEHPNVTGAIFHVFRSLTLTTDLSPPILEP